jgi:hypothetical protein
MEWNLNFIELILDSIEFNFDWIHMQFNSNSIENKWDAKGIEHLLMTMLLKKHL